MQKCLGIYVEPNIIKYAKVSKDHDNIKIEAYGVRFYDSLSAEIGKIIEETSCFNTPLSVNLANENYLYFDIFALFNKRDIEKTIEIEFDTYCEERKRNRNAFDMNYALMKNVQENEKIRAMNIYVNKIEMNKQMQPFEGYKSKKAVPTPIAIANLVKTEKKENALIVNMEETTSITTIIEQNIYSVETIELGSANILDRINQEENSYSKAYEICKNTTIYTAEAEKTEDEQPYLQYIVPVLFDIAQEVQKIANEDWRKIKKIYLTGTMASINNIDLYFQEFLPDFESQILQPSFLKSNTKVNIKEYIEVNSATALALSGLGEGIQAFNFPKSTTGDKIKQFLKLDINSQLSSLGSKKSKSLISPDERWIVRTISAVALILIIFIVFSKLLQGAMEDKMSEIKEAQSLEQGQIDFVESKTKSLESKKNKYDSLTRDLEEIDRKTSDIAASRNLIPNLLNQIMFIIPEKVQLTSIENANGKTVTIQGSSSDYDQLGYFIATLKTKGILKNVISSTGVKSGEIVTVTIEGELP